MSYSERVKNLVEYEGTQAKFCRKVGLSKQAVNRIINQGSGLNGETIVAIAEAYPNLNLDWFIAGKGEMWKPDVPAQRDVPLTPEDIVAMKDEIIALQKQQIENLKRAILEKAPELGKYLKIENK